MRQGAHPRTALCPSCRAQLHEQPSHCADCATPRPAGGWPTSLDEAANTLHAALTYTDELPPSIAPPMILETPVPQPARSDAAPPRPSTPATAPVRPIQAPPRPATPPTEPVRPSSGPFAPVPESIPLMHDLHEPPSMSTLHTSTPTVIPARSLWAVTVAGLLLLIGITALALWMPNAANLASIQPDGPALNLPDSSAAPALIEPTIATPPTGELAEATTDVVADLSEPDMVTPTAPRTTPPTPRAPLPTASSAPPAQEASAVVDAVIDAPSSDVAQPIEDITAPIEAITAPVEAITAPVEAVAAPPVPKAFDPSPLSGDWSGTLFGRKWRLHVDLQSNGTVSGTSQIFAGARQVHNQLKGTWTQRDQGVEITVTELDAERPTTHVGSLHGNKGSGYTTVGGRKRGTWDVRR